MSEALFHIHIDARDISQVFERFATSKGFARTDFAEEPHVVECYAPIHHLTLKTRSSEHFRTVFEALTARLEDCGGVTGYLEGEYVASDVDIPEDPYTSPTSIPFRLQTKQLPANAFRETEIHITMNRQRSDPRVGEALRSMGLMVASMNKHSGPAAIYTAQGTKQQVATILPLLTQYLRTSGGCAECSIKEERIVSWWKSSAEFELPPVIDEIVIPAQ